MTFAEYAVIAAAFNEATQQFLAFNLDEVRGAKSSHAEVLRSITGLMPMLPAHVLAVAVEVAPQEVPSDVGQPVEEV